MRIEPCTFRCLWAVIAPVARRSFLPPEFYGYHKTGFALQSARGSWCDCAEWSKPAQSHQVALLAEANNHHPDIMIQYKRISVRYWTHTTSGVTLADVQMAQKVDTLF